MSKSLTISFSPNVQGFNCITSNSVAELFGRKHGDVLKSVASLRAEEGEVGELFSPTSYVDSWNRKQQRYLLTESGFVLLLKSFNLRSKEDKELRKTILLRFQEKLQQQLARTLKLELAAAHKADNKGKWGYIEVMNEETGFPEAVKVLREGHTVIELLRGGILHKRNIIFGIEKGIRKSEERIAEILAEDNDE